MVTKTHNFIFDHFHGRPKSPAQLLLNIAEHGT